MMNLLLQKSNHRRWDWRFRFIFRRISGHRLRASVFALLALSAAASVVAQDQQDSEYAVKLGFLYNFTKFIEWPAASFRDPRAALVLCIIGHDPFRQDLEAELRTRKAGTHPVEVKILTANDKPSACHIVFIPVSEKNQSDRILREPPGSGILTIGETEGFAVLGGVINLTVEANKVHFEINRAAADRAGLKIGSKLLSIAKIVKEREHGRKS